MSKIKIVAAILDTHELTLYKENGERIYIKQGDSRVQRIIDEATVQLSAHGWAEVDLALADPDKNDYKDFEDQSGGIKFFRVAKKWLKGLFHAGEEHEVHDGIYGAHKYVAPVSLGTIPGTEAPTAADVRDATQNQKPDLKSATDQIMANAKSVSDKDYSSHDTKEDDTMIAEVTHPVTGEKAIIPGVENLKGQFALAAKLGSTGGVEKFLQRLGAVIADRGHTVEELLRFMSRGDLPIADDGSIIAYKVLNRKTDSTFVDVHSGQIVQRVGSFVCQEKVDPSRRTECSTGLHIARRGYLSMFSGSAMVLVKIAPEDVIAVPTGEPNKMRARGYHIISNIPSDQHQILKNNRPLESEEARKLLAMAIKGDHIQIIEDVIVGGPKGTNVTVTPRGVKGGLKTEPKIRQEIAPSETIQHDDEKEKNNAPKVNPVKAAAEVTETKQKLAAPTKETRAEKITRLSNLILSNEKLDIRVKAATELSDLKKTSKQPWGKLNVNKSLLVVIEQLTSGSEPEKKDPNAHLKTTAEAGKRMADAKQAKAPAKSGSKPKGKSNAKAKAPVPEAPVRVPVETVGMSRNERVRALFDNGQYDEVRAIKKSAKVSYDRLGLTFEEAAKLTSK